MSENKYSKQEIQVLVKELAKYSSATVHEALGRVGAVDYGIKPISKGMKICGPAVTVCCHVGDNLMLHKAVAAADPGDVIIADMGSNRQQGSWGDVLSTQAHHNGINGFVTNSGVRDSEEITQMGFSVFSGSICIAGTVKATIGTLNEAISFGGVIVNPGDIVLGDDDGIMIVPQGRLQEAIDASRAREEKETIMKEKIRQGATTAELLGLLEQLGM